MKRTITSLEAQQLWEQYRTGDLYALAQIMQVHYADLFHWGLRLCDEREFVKDCIQDVFLSLHRQHKKIGQVANVRSYLLAVLKSRILRELSQKHIRNKTHLTDEYSFSVEFAADLQLIERESEFMNITRLHELLGELPSRQKEIIYLRFYQNLSFEQIAEVMNLGKQSVYNLMQKSLKSLRANWTFLWNALLLAWLG